MRLNLGCGKDIRYGYVNVDIIQKDQSENYKIGDMRTLDWLVDDGVVDEIVALDCLEYIELSQIQGVVEHWATKLKQGGMLKILIPDVFAISRAFSQGQFSLQEFNTIVFGTQNEYDTRRSVLDTHTLCDILSNCGLEIELKRYEGVAIYMEAKK